MNTKLSQKTISGALAVEIIRQIAIFLLLIGIGAIGVLIHAKFRTPLGIPGRWGLIYMALLIAAKLATKKSYAASLSSLGAAAMLLFPLGYNDPFMPVTYMIPGFIVDVFFRFGETWRNKILLIALACGLAYMTLPVTRIIINQITGYPFGSLIKWGFVGTMVWHLAFGFLGGLAGTAIFRAFNTIQKK